MIIVNRTRKYKVNKSRIKRLIKFLIEKTGSKVKNLSIVFCGERFIRNYNKKYRKKDQTTDILSFESFEDNYLGDLIISIPDVYKNSIREKVPFDEELLRIITHGFLHLLRYEHKEKDSPMIELQEKLLKEFMKKDG